jgi:uncharacterized protein (DUF1800 family)
MSRVPVPPRVAHLSHTRARILAVAVALATVLAVPVQTVHAQPSAPAANAPSPSAQVPGSRGATRLSESDAAWRAASRLGYWPSTEIVRAIREHPRGAEGWALDEIDRAFDASRQAPRIPQQLSSLTQPLPAVFSEFQREREARKQGEEKLQKMEGAAQNRREGPALFSRTAAQEAAAWRMLSCADPALENPLLARMTEFWFNHLNVFVGKGPVRPFVGDYVINVIRPNVLGRYETLLLASARHPAMLFYLDQAQNVADGSAGARGVARGINENYARELMELHTLGVDGGYTQRDVRELARVLTGWTVDPFGNSGFRFVERLHDQGEKVVLGRRFAAEGEREGVRAIAMLAEQPATARRIARRLTQFFVADEPSPALVERLAAEYQAGRGDLRRVMRTLVRSPEFWEPANELFKTPFDFACSALGATTVAARGGGAAIAGMRPAADGAGMMPAPPGMRAQGEMPGGMPGAPGAGAPRGRVGGALVFLASAGQPVHGWQTPDGYRTDANTWLSPEALTRRVDLAAVLGAGVDEPTQLIAFFGPATRERINRAPAASRAALAVASPDFMRK